MNDDIALQIGQTAFFAGHFDVPLMLEDARMLRGWHECRFRSLDGSLEEAVFPFKETDPLARSFQLITASVEPADPEKIQLLVKSARIRLPCAHDCQSAVSISGTRALPDQTESAFCDKIQ